MFNKLECSHKMNTEQIEQLLNSLQDRICSMIEHPEQITLENVQSLKLPKINVNNDIINRLKEYSDGRINDQI